MKAFLSILILVFLCLSCEEKVDIPLKEGPEELVVEATAIQFEEAEIAQLNVSLTKTSGFYQESNPPVTEAQISLKIGEETVAITPDDSIAGLYSGIIPVQNNTVYHLSIDQDGQIFKAETELAQSAAIDTLIQNNNGGFDPDKTGVDVVFTDPPAEGNCYLFDYDSRIERSLSSICDDQFNGNQFSSFYAEEFKSGDSLEVRLQGIDERFQNYFSLISSQSSDGGNPFATAPATARGNIVNVTNPDDKPLGYFRISQEYSRTFIFN